jgi:FAD/FMN-containing dehydrogenase
MTTQQTTTVHSRGSPDYEKYRRTYVNGCVPSRYPREIYVPADVDGVVTAVRRAQQLNAPVGVRSGGHLFPCTSLLEDGILVDMSNVYRRVSYNPQTHIIDFGPAVRVKEAAEELLRRNRFFPTGHAPTVAFGGFCLAGGQGWFMRGWGATVEQWIMQIEVVLPSGEIIIANREQNADIFWAARGSGQWFFGIITRIWGRTIPARQLFHRTLLFRVDDSFEQLLAYVFEQNRRTSKYGTETAACTFYPDKYNPEANGDEVKDMPLLLGVESVAYVDTVEEARTILGVWAKVPASLEKLVVQDDPVRATTWTELFAAQDALVPCGNGERWICDSILNDPSIEERKVSSQWQRL